MGEGGGGRGLTAENTHCSTRSSMKQKSGTGEKVLVTGLNGDCVTMGVALTMVQLKRVHVPFNTHAGMDWIGGTFLLGAHSK